MNRKNYFWKLRSVDLQLGEKTLIMGILNVTPDSFSDGGRFSDPDRAYAHALELEEQGADIIDIGAESTRPGSQRISAEEEWRRLAPVLKRLRDKLNVPVSLDTYKSETAERALEYGIEIINDPSGLTFDADLAKTVGNANAGLILNHMRGTPETWAKLPPLPDMIGSVARDLEATVNRARRAGVERNRIAVDPGLGFGKRREQNAEILAHLRQLAALDCPLLVGPSRKSFLAQSTEPETLYATAAAVAVSIMNGAHIVRVHDVKEMRSVVQLVDEVVRAADAKQEAQAAAEAAAAEKRPAPRRSVREFEDRPRAVMPPVVRKTVKAPVVEVAPPVVTEAAPEVPAVEAAGEVLQLPEPVVAPEPATEVKPEPKPEAKPPAKSFGDRPVRRVSTDRPPRREFGDRPPRRDFGDSRPPRKDFGDRPPRKEYGDSRPPRREFSDRPPRKEFSDSRPPRKDFGDRAPRKDYGDSRPPRREFSDKPPRKTFGDRPPRKEFGDKPPRKTFGDRPPRRDFGDKPPRKDFGDRPARKEFGDSRPPRREFGDKPARKPFGDRPPRRDFGDKAPRKDFGDRPPRRDAGPPRGKGPSDRGPRPPSRPFRKRP